jgi:hypothetical protein
LSLSDCVRTELFEGEGGRPEGTRDKTDAIKDNLSVADSLSIS